MQPRKTACLYHPDENITNFCRDSTQNIIKENCLMPLCPSCIRDHSLYHEQNQTKPAYFNIYQILSNVQNQLYTTIYSLEQNRSRNVELMRKIQALDGYVKEKILTTKTMMYNLIDQAFMELQSELKNNLARFHEEIGLYSIKKSQKFQESLSQVLSDLYNINDGLKSQKYLGNIIVFLKDKFQQGTTFNNKIHSYLQANESYQPRIELSNEAKSAIIANVSRLFKFDGKKELDRKKQKQQETRTSVFKGAKPVNKDLSEKNEKIERSYTPQKSIAYMKTVSGDTSSRAKLLNPNNSPYRQKLQMSYRHYQQPLANANQIYPTTTDSSNRIRDFKQQFQILSKKVSQMKKENQLIAKQFK